MMDMERGGINMMDMEKGLYEVEIERENMFFNSWTRTPKDVEVKYVLVNDCKAFEKWLANIYTEGNEQGIKFREVRRIDYRKVSETCTLL